MAITVRKLEVFLEAAARGSFRQAADELGISQPSVSIQIADLEADIGFALFRRRSGARPRLTEAGQGFVEKAHALIATFDELGSKASTPSPRTKLVVATGAALLNRLKPELPGLIMRNPGADIEFLTIGSLDELLEALDQRLVDLGVYTGALPRSSTHPAIIISNVSYSIYASPEVIPLWTSKGGRDDPLPVALPPAAGAVADRIERRFHDAGFEHIAVVGRSQFPDVLISMATDGAAAIILPADVVRSHVRSGRLAPLRIDAGSGYRYMLLGAKALQSPGREIVEHLRSIILDGGVARETGQAGGRR